MRWIGWVFRVAGYCDTAASIIGGWPVVVSAIATVATLIWGFFENLGAAIIPYGMLALVVGLVGTEGIQDFIKRLRKRWGEKITLARSLVKLSLEGVALRHKPVQVGGPDDQSDGFLQDVIDWDNRVTALLKRLKPSEYQTYITCSEAFSDIAAKYGDRHRRVHSIMTALGHRVVNFNAIVRWQLERSKLTAGELLDEKQKTSVP